MTKQEFESRTGLKVSEEEFSKINELYMNCGDNIDKDTFCLGYENHHLFQNNIIVEGLNSEVKNLRNRAANFRMALFNAAYGMIKKSCVYEDRELRNEAVAILGERKVVIYKISNDLCLWDEDKEYIREHLQ